MVYQLVPERLPERIDGHFVAYPADCGHHQLESADKLRRGSSSLCDRLQRSTSEVSLSMNIEYCLKNIEYIE